MAKARKQVKAPSTRRKTADTRNLPGNTRKGVKDTNRARKAAPRKTGR